jgi:starch synthase
VRRVGGLADTVDDGVTGFAFDGYTSEAFQEAGFRALRGYAESAKWQAMVRRGMARDFSWERSVDQYLEVYRRAIAQAAMR